MSLTHRISSCEYLPRVISDHAPLSLTIAPMENFQIFYRWRVNPHLLNNADFEPFIIAHTKLFSETNSETVPSPFILWESLKAYLRGQIISFLEKDSLKHLDTLELNIINLENEHSRTRSEGLY